MEHIERQENYSLGSGNLTLSITIGDGQYGSSLIMLDKTTLAIGTIINLNLGSADDLRGKKLLIESTVRDVRPETNHTSETISLRDNSNSDRIENHKELDENGGTVIYTTTIELS